MAQRWFEKDGKPLGAYDGPDPLPPPYDTAMEVAGPPPQLDPPEPEPDKAEVLADLLENESNDAAAWRQRYEQARDRVSRRQR